MTTHRGGRFVRILCLMAILLEELAYSQVSVLTQHNNNQRSGANLQETALTTSNVNVTGFGLLFSRTLDDQVYTQPLYVPNVTISGQGVHNVVYVATVNNSVYAFDADSATATTPLWHVNLGTPANHSAISATCNDMSGNMGIVGTPVIDSASGTLYVVALTNDSGTYNQRLHALDITSGSEKTNSPVIINQTGYDALHQNPRPGLLLYNGVVYITAASHCDMGPYHGWILGYNATTLAQVTAFNVTPTGVFGGIWQSGQGPSVDSNGNIYLMTGNGTWDGTSNFGLSFLKLATNSGGAVSLTDWFTPSDYQNENSADLDLGSSGPLLIPGTTPQLIVGGGKEGIFYLLNTTNMGHEVTNDTQVLQKFQAVVISNGASTAHIHGSPVYWNSNTNGPLIYVWGENDHLREYKFVSGLFQTSAFATSSVVAPAGMPGCMLSISANGGAAGTGIVWANCVYSGDANSGTVPGIFRAYNADNVGATELWDSKQNARDDCGNFAKFTYPTIANGKVYLSSFASQLSGTGQLCVYGLLSGATPPPVPANLAATPGNTQVSLTWTASSGATSYNVKRAATSEGPYTTISSPATNSYTDTGLTNGTAYYYVVSAINSAGESSNSSQVSATPQVASPPSAPTNLLASPGNAQASLSWTASSGATSYNVKRGTVNGGPYSSIVTGVANTTYSDTGLTNGTTYYYVVTAVNASGESANSNQASVTPSTVFLYEAESLTVAASSGQTWRTSTDANCSGGVCAFFDATAVGNYVTLTVNVAQAGTYDVQIGTKLNTTRGIFQLATATTTNGTYTNQGAPQDQYGAVAYTFQDLGNVTFSTASSTMAFRFTVTGKNSASSGYGLCIDYIKLIPIGVPPAPTGLSATAGNTQISLAWTASTGATSYNVKRATTNGGPYTTIASPSRNSYTDTGLTSGTTYYYVVTAVNTAGESGNSNQASATPASSGVPPAPTGLTASAGDTEVSLSWAASSGATSYNVKRATVSGGPYTTITTAGAQTALSYSDISLTNGTAYYYVVTAVNSSGESGNSNQASATPVANNTIIYQMESLTIGASSGKTASTVVDASCNAGECVSYASSAAGDYVTFVVDVPQARTYDVRIGVKQGSSEGIFQLATSASVTGSYTDHGSAQDLYSAGTAYTELDIGNVVFGSAGTSKGFRFTVTGKNASSSGYSLSLDYIKLIPQ